MTIILSREQERMLTEIVQAGGARSIEDALNLAIQTFHTTHVKATSMPFQSCYGIWAKLGTAPSMEEIEQNRREMFRGLSEDTLD